MKRYLAVALATSAIIFAGQVMAAEVDMSKMTCKDAAALGKGKLAAVAIWVSGAAAGKSGNMMVDTEKMAANGEKAQAYCEKNPDSTLADAVSKM